MRETTPQDLGFGVAITGQRRARLVNPDGTFNVERARSSLLDHLSYRGMLSMGWPAFFLDVAIIFLGINLLFAAAYLLCGPRGLAASAPAVVGNRFLQAFFFSVDTFTTIGYGNIVPVSRAANLLVTLEAITGLMSAALITGLLFARFSRPHVRFQFAPRAVVRLRERPALLVRFRNTTRNEVIEVQATMMLWLHDPEAQSQRRFYTLPLERNHITFLPLSWTLAHFITPDSPLHGMSADQFRLDDGEVMVQIRGIDQASSQTVYARVSYTAGECVWDARFANAYLHDDKGSLLGIDDRRFGKVERETT